jgi:putative nucleotidyltransferase with HDIG domain
MQIDDHIASFKRYVKLYYGEDEFINRNISLKEDHTLRVLDIARRICSEEKLDPPTAEMAVFAALYHDIGRFEQFKTYRTFIDGASVNHAHLGAEILRNNNLLEGLDTPDAGIVITAVECHNMKEIPSDLPHIAETVLKVVRDADKIDIMQILCEYYNQRSSAANEALELGLPDTPGYTAEIYDDVYNGRGVLNSLRKNYNDMKLGHLAWIYDLNFSSSFRIYRENNYVGKIIRHLPDNPEIKKLQDKLNYEIDVKLGLSF